MYTYNVNYSSPNLVSYTAILGHCRSQKDLRYNKILCPLKPDYSPLFVILCHTEATMKHGLSPLPLLLVSVHILSVWPSP